MSLSIAIIVTTILFVLLTIAVKEGRKGTVALAAVVINSGLSSYAAIKVIAGQPCHEFFYGGSVFEGIPIRVDALSAWFILLMNFTVFTGILYGRRYMKQYENQSANLTQIGRAHV